MSKEKETKIKVASHWRHQLTQMRCWVDGYKAGRNDPGAMPYHIPGEDVLRQIIMAIDDA